MKNVYFEGFSSISFVASSEHRIGLLILLQVQMTNGVHAPSHGWPVAAGHRLVERQVVTPRGPRIDNITEIPILILSKELRYE
jgi:hypothetical protein